MKRRDFIFNTTRLAVAASLAPAILTRASAREAQDKLNRIAMGTLIFRYQFKQTKPREMPVIKNELTLLDVPEFYRDKFGIRKIEFWNEHFESLEPDYLAKLKGKIKAAGSQLVDVQIDRISYDLASENEETRLKSIKDVKQWMDAVSFLGSECIRVNPGRPRGSVDKSIESLKELNAYARNKNLIIITANHFGLEMDPDKHVRIAKEAGVHTEPDFGNYPHDATLLPKLEKIVPYAFIVSAKVDEFNSNIEHISYDFDSCVRLCEKLGFRGDYMVAQWSAKFQDIDYDKVANWVISHIKENISA
ncbi:MAG TPA: TIM barrel protein [Verrucomicrobiae bacterium]|jgi:sugar phosphate isomerase/epimerase|nr:TIM barrel protein [Verrucomicrobiae bacterium]